MSLKMLLVHDIVEIDAGDTYCYDAAGNDDKAEREQVAAHRIFGLLPDDQRDEMHRLWEEFEARETSEARFAAALDRLMPILHNYHTQGRSWQEHGITQAQVLGAQPAFWGRLEKPLELHRGIDRGRGRQGVFGGGSKIMTITLTPEIEAGLLERAQEQGTTPEGLALEWLRETFALSGEPDAISLAPVDYRATLPPPLNEWQRQLRSIGVPCGVSLTDEQVSRDSLYDDHL